MFSKYASVFLKFFRRNLNFFLALKYVFATVSCHLIYTLRSAFPFCSVLWFKVIMAFVVKISQNKLFLQHCTPAKHCSLRYPRLSLFNCGETRLFYNAKGDKVVSPGQIPIFLQHSASVQSWRTGSYSMTLYRNLIWEKNYNVYSCSDLW